jgi:hypothetical protein
MRRCAGRKKDSRDKPNRMSRSRAKNVVLVLSLCANVVLASVASYYWLKTRSTELGLPSKADALKSVAGGAFLPSVRIEFRIAEEQDNDGLTAVSHEGGSPSTLYVRPEVIISNGDIEAAAATRDERGQPAVRLTLSEAGRRKLSDAATANRMKRLAILVDGKAILAPYMEGPVEERTVNMTGAITEHDAERIALAFARR